MPLSGPKTRESSSPAVQKPEAESQKWKVAAAMADRIRGALFVCRSTGYKFSWPASGSGKNWPAANKPAERPQTGSCNTPAARPDGVALLMFFFQ